MVGVMGSQTAGISSGEKIPVLGFGGWQSHESCSVGSAAVAALLQSRGASSLKMQAYSRSTRSPSCSPLGAAELVIHSRPLMGSDPWGDDAFETGKPPEGTGTAVRGL